MPNGLCFCCLFHSDISLAFTYLLSKRSVQLNLENNCNADRHKIFEINMNIKVVYVLREQSF